MYARVQVWLKPWRLRVTFDGDSRAVYQHRFTRKYQILSR